ncbi:MAG: hypothetical protein K5696_09535 [Lachnospiraceae bacterium]|nr:hypothetical protein [Lachnospiraceae bacterium]
MKKWTKHRLFALGAAFVAILAMITGCTFDPEEEPVDVYGPAPDFEENENWDIAPDDTDVIQTLYGPAPEFNANENWDDDKKE